ncbi:hypothetical protein JCM19239_5311 [Vibrio variabilis]|uniref:Uncharacterized protein n=1 Tax=Vibrio variabilis TaxID=990271 RepID=A0ABQ0JNR7_9VIBR|nr:hypothetical protein JCM19239_5311 [Vibrio variabilis]
MNETIMEEILTMAMEGVTQMENRIRDLPSDCHSWLREERWVKMIFDIKDFFPAYYARVYDILDRASNRAKLNKESTTRMMIEQVFRCATDTTIKIQGVPYAKVS